MEKMKLFNFVPHLDFHTDWRRFAQPDFCTIEYTPLERILDGRDSNQS
jgi:hypothetical protein